MEDFQQRVVDEAAEVRERFDKLILFVRGEVFTTLPNAEQNRLHRQVAHMAGYLGVLNERIAAF